MSGTAEENATNAVPLYGLKRFYLESEAMESKTTEENMMTEVAVKSGEIKNETMEMATKRAGEIKNAEVVIGLVTGNQTTDTTAGMGERMEGRFSYKDIYNYVWKKEYLSSLTNKEEKQALRKRATFF